MGLRFWRRFQILPGVTLNISKSGVSFSFGVRGLKYTVGRGSRLTVGLPGTGLSYTRVKSASNDDDIYDEPSGDVDISKANLRRLRRKLQSME